MESGGEFVAVTRPRSARPAAQVEELEGLSPCFTASAAVAGLASLARRGAVPKDDTYLVNLTGADRPPMPPLKDVHWLRRGAAGWQPEDPHDAAGRALWQSPA